MPHKIYLSFFIFYKIIFASGLNFSGRSYYFKTNGNNEFTVYNRIHFLNHNISDFDANPHTPFRPQNIKVTSKNVVTSDFGNKEHDKNVNFFNTYLDEEWNYDHTPNNKTDLPVFINKMYEQRTKDSSRTNTIRILFNENSNSSSGIIKFNLESLMTNENVSDADLYFYWPLENSSSIYKTSVVLRLYQFEKQFNNELNESNLIENPDIHKLFNVIYISKAQKGWQTFKLKKPIDNWANGEENMGLLLTISSYDENKLISIYNDTNKGVFRTFAVINIQKNETYVHPKTNTTISKYPDSDNSTSTLFSKMCSKKPWQVDFKQLKWNRFTLYPESGFMAYHCIGKCHFNDSGKNSHLNNYAALRQFNNVHHVGHKDKICCVPTDFLSLPIMYFDKYDNIVLKNYDNMVVDKCGCR